MSNIQNFKLIKLEQTNYVIWKWQFCNIAKSMGLSSLFSSDESKVSSDDNLKGLSLLGSALSDENILKIINCQTFGAAWRTLEICFENKTTYEPQALFRRLHSYKIGSASEVSRGVSEMRGIVAQLKNLNEEVSDNNLIGSIISALPESFKIFISIWKNSNEKDMNSFVSKLMAEANEQTNDVTQDVPALNARAKRNDKAAKFKGVKKSRKSRENDECHYCKERGHWAPDCPKRKKDKSKKSDKGSSESNYKDFALIGNIFPQSESKDNLWVADSGCSMHMSLRKDWFRNLRESNIEFVYTADRKTKIPVEGEGEIQTKVGILMNVLYVPQLRQNLFSINAVSLKGVTHKGDSKSMIFYRDNTEIFKAIKSENLYFIKFEIEKIDQYASAATLSDWHARFGHISNETIQLMHKNNMVNDLDIVHKSNDRCCACCLNKVHQVSHPSRTSDKSSVAGNVLHIDTSGPMIPTLSGSKYLILCKDEATAYRQIAFVADKTQIQFKVKEFISRTLLETNNSVLKIITDNGSEYVNKQLTDYLQERGIIHEKSAPYTPSQNGFVERDIQTVKNAAKTMLNDSGLDLKLWAEACNTAVYVLNRSVNSVNKYQTPYEGWFRTKPSVKNLRVFGELAILKNQDRYLPNAWSKRGLNVVFVGYTERFNTYRVWNPKTNKISIACDLVFINQKYSGGELICPKENNEHWVVCSGQTNSKDQQSLGDEQIILEEQDTHLEGETSQDQTLEDVTPPVSQSSNHRKTIGQTLRDFVGVGNQSSDSSIDEIAIAPKHVYQQRLIDVDVSGIPTGSSNKSNLLSYNDTVKFIKENSDKMVHLKTSSGKTILRIGDLIFNENYGRWKNQQNGQFISKSHIKIVHDKLTGQQGNYVCAYLAVGEILVPRNYEEATSGEHAQYWIEAMEDELASLRENDVFTEIPTSQISKKPVSSRWVFTVKSKPNGEVEKFKARVVARGFSQVYGIDFTETYCSVVQIMSTRLILSHAARNNLLIKQFDIKTAFLYGKLNETIYMTPPEGFSDPRTTWLLNRSLYGLKQSPRMWNQRFNEVLSQLGFQVSNYDSSVFFSSDPYVILIVYVDDGLLFAKEIGDITRILSKLNEEFKMRELEVNMYRGLQIEQFDDGILIHQSSYVQKILNNYQMKSCKPSNNPILQNDSDENEELGEDKPYRSIVGSLSYLADTCRPDIAFAVNRLARQMSKPTMNSWRQSQHVLRYLAGTADYGIWFSKKVTNTCLIGYCDSDFAGDRETAKSTTGYIMLLNGAPFHWKTQLQRHVSLSSTEAEVIAFCSLSVELAWIRRFMLELNMIEDIPAIIRCDNQSSIRIVASERYTARTRHLRAKNSFVKEQVDHGELKLEYVRSELQRADMLTKMLPTGKLLANRNALMVKKSNKIICTPSRKDRNQQFASLAILSLTILCLAAPSLAGYSELRRVQIDINSPCETYARNYKQMIRKTHWQTKKVLMWQERHICEAKISSFVLPALSELKKCDSHQSRTKRGVFETVGAAARVVAGATNFIADAIEDPIGFGKRTLQNLGAIVDGRASDFLNDRQLISQAQIRDMGLVSESSRLHEVSLLNMLQNEDDLWIMWAAYHLMREVMTGVANLRSLSEHCLRGNLGTAEIADLIGDRRFLEISSEDTAIDSIDVDVDDWIIDISYRVKDKSISWLVITIIGLCSLFLISSTILYYIIHITKKESTPIYELEALPQGG